MPQVSKVETVNLPNAPTVHLRNYGGKLTTVELIDDCYHYKIVYELKVDPSQKCKVHLKRNGHNRLTLVDLPVGFRQSRIQVHLQRYQCTKCGQTFQAQLPDNVRYEKEVNGEVRRFNHTRQLQKWLEWKWSQGATVHWLSQVTGLGESSIFFLLDEHSMQGEPETLGKAYPKVIAIDEIKRGKEKYLTVFLIVQNSQLVLFDIKEERTEDITAEGVGALLQLCKKHPKYKNDRKGPIIISDTWQDFPKGAKTAYKKHGFDPPVMIADKFHVIRKVVKEHAVIQHQLRQVRPWDFDWELIKACKILAHDIYVGLISFYKSTKYVKSTEKQLTDIKERIKEFQPVYEHFKLGYGYAGLLTIIETSFNEILNYFKVKSSLPSTFQVDVAYTEIPIDDQQPTIQSPKETPDPNTEPGTDTQELATSPIKVEDQENREEHEVEETDSSTPSLNRVFFPLTNSPTEAFNLNIRTLDRAAHGHKNVNHLIKRAKARYGLAPITFDDFELKTPTPYKPTTGCHNCGDLNLIKTEESVTRVHYNIPVGFLCTKELFIYPKYVCRSCQKEYRYSAFSETLRSNKVVFEPGFLDFARQRLIDGESFAQVTRETGLSYHRLKNLKVSLPTRIDQDVAYKNFAITNISWGRRKNYSFNKNDPASKPVFNGLFALLVETDTGKLLRLDEVYSKRSSIKYYLVDAKTTYAPFLMLDISLRLLAQIDHFKSLTEIGILIDTKKNKTEENKTEENNLKEEKLPYYKEQAVKRKWTIAIDKYQVRLHCLSLINLLITEHIGRQPKLWSKAERKRVFGTWLSPLTSSNSIVDPRVEKIYRISQQHYDLSASTTQAAARTNLGGLITELKAFEEFMKPSRTSKVFIERIGLLEQLTPLILNAYPEVEGTILPNAARARVLKAKIREMDRKIRGHSNVATFKKKVLHQFS